MVIRTKAELIPLSRVSALGGVIIKVARADAREYRGFGELYFSSLEVGHFRGWKTHREMTSTLFCVSGRAEVHVTNVGASCKTYPLLNFLHEEAEALVISPGAVYGIRAIGEVPTVVGNLASTPHDENEITRFESAYHSCGWAS